MRFSTRAIHVGSDPDPATGATIPPVVFSSTYTQSAPGVHKGYEYSRTQNPTRERVEACLAALEGGEAAAAFSSGLAATTAVLQSLRPGDGVAGSHDLYGGTFRLLEQVFRPWGLEVAYADGPSTDDYEKAIRSLSRPRLLWLETPTNPLLDIVDITELTALAQGHGMLAVVDNTFATPYLQRPLEKGADLVVHSTTKYLGGHSDVVGGAVIARRAEFLESIRFLQNATGAIPGPLDCYLLHRGIKTLGVRMERHCWNAHRVAEWLAGRPEVHRVYYPGLEGHPGREIARRQMSDFGGMVSVRFRGEPERATSFLKGLRVFSLAESLGGVESLCSHPATMTHASIPRERREAIGIVDSLVRLSVGIEDIEDLLEDLEEALRTL